MRLAARHEGEVDFSAAAAAGRDLGQRAGQPAGAEVLHRDHRVRAVQLQAGLHQQLLEERVADLDRRPPLVAILPERGGREARPLDPVPAGRGADQQQGVARPGGARERHLVVTGDPDAHRVDQRVAVVGRVEADLAAHVGDADAVPVARDPGHHPAEQVAVPGDRGGIGPAGGVLERVERTEAQRVQERDRPGAHREDVADDAAHPGGRTLVRLHRRRVVVRLDLEDDRQPLADVDRPGILPGADQDPLAAGRQEAEQWARVLVGAVLAPHGPEHPELHRIRLAAERRHDQLVLRLGQPVSLRRRGDRHGAIRLARAGSATRSPRSGRRAGR